MTTDLVPTIPHPCGCRTSGIDGYRYPCPEHRTYRPGDLAPPGWPGPRTCDDLAAVACAACGLAFLRPYGAIRPEQCAGCDEIDRIEADV